MMSRESRAVSLLWSDHNNGQSVQREAILFAAEAESILDLITTGIMVRPWLFNSKIGMMTYMERVAPS